MGRGRDWGSGIETMLGPSDKRNCLYEHQRVGSDPIFHLMVLEVLLTDLENSALTPGQWDHALQKDLSMVGPRTELELRKKCPTNFNLTIVQKAF